LKTLFASLFFLAALVILPHAPGHAEVYKYVDKKGRVHYTDNPDQLPEPERSRVLRELEEKIKKEQERRRKLKEQGIQVPDERLPPPRPPQPPPGPHPATDRLEQRHAARKAWEARAQKARARVTKLEEKCAELKTERDRSRRDSLTFSRPGAGQRYRKAQAAHQSCQRELKSARNYLDVVLPEQARKAGIPPGWIR
jgi:hypothetical protein